MVAPMLMQIQTWLMQTKVWRYVGFASAVVGLLCYALSSSFNYLFGEWNLLKIFLFVVFSFITCVVILFAETWQHSRSHGFKAHIAFLVLTITSVYSFFFDKLMNGKPADAYSLISCAAFAVMSLSLSKQTQCGFEVDLLHFFLGCLIVQLMKTKLPWVIVGLGFSYSLVVLRSSFSSMDAAAPDNEYPGLLDSNSVALDIDPPQLASFSSMDEYPGLPDDNSADPDVDSLQLASFSPAVAAAPDNSGLPDDNSGDPDADSLQLATSTDVASSMMEQPSRPPADAVNVSGYFQDAGPDAMPGNPYQQQQLHQRQSRRKLERTHTVLLTTYDPFESTRAIITTTSDMFDKIRPLLLDLDSSLWAKEIGTTDDMLMTTDDMPMTELLDSVINDGLQEAAKSRERLQVAAKSRERVQLPAAKDRRSSYKKSHMLTTNSRQHLRHRSSRAKE